MERFKRIEDAREFFRMLNHYSTSDFGHGRSVFALSSFLCFSFVVQCREYQLCVVCYFGFYVLLRFCFLLRFWISPSRKSLLQIFPAWEYIAYRQVFGISQLSIAPSPVLFPWRFFPTHIYAVLCVCNHEDPRTYVLSIDITIFFGRSGPGCSKGE